MDLIRSEVVKAEFESKHSKALFGSGKDAISWDLEELITTPYVISLATLASNALKANRRFPLLHPTAGNIYWIKPLGMTESSNESIYQVHTLDVNPADQFLVIPKLIDNISAELYTFYKSTPPAKKGPAWHNEKITVTTTIDGGEPVL